MEPLISIIVPIYNVEAYLPRCLDSIVGQTYRNLEIILVDDGSPDNCGVICDRYAEEDSRIRVIHQQNAGVSAARNAGLDVMSGEYIMFVDPDDWISLDAVQLLYERLIGDGSDLIIGKKTDVYEDMTADGSFCEWMTDAIFSRDEITCFMASTCKLSVSTWGKLYKRKIMETIRFPAVRVAEDLAVFTMVLDRCEKISTSQHIVYYYFQHPESVMHRLNDTLRMQQLGYNIQMLRYLAEEKTLSSVTKWFGICVDIVYFSDDRSKGKEMLQEAFTQEELRILLRKQSAKTYIKWAAINNVLAGKAVAFAEKQWCKCCKR